MMQHAEGSQAPEEPTSSQDAPVKEATPAQAWQTLQNNDKAILVDVRTEQELPADGQPDLSSMGGDPLLVSWRLAPDFQANPHFMEQLKSKVSSDTPLFFLCRSGGRSYEAAQKAQAEGFAECYNVTGGMDGEQGWKASGLAWRQAS